MMMKKLLQLIRFLFVKQDVMEVYYIQGNDVLPKPLDKEEELAALSALENGDEEARNTLIEHIFVLSYTSQSAMKPIRFSWRI